MAAITAAQIKELRDRTNVGMAKCKAALTEAEGDIELAVQNLRKAGLASAGKKADREAKEGLIDFASGTSCEALVEINAETDFVVRNENFQQFCKNIAEEVAQSCPKSLEDFMQQKFTKDSSQSIEEYRATMIQSIGENIQVSRIACFDKKADHSVGIYSHAGGKMVALVELSGADDQQSLARELAMHTAASRPEFVSKDTVPADTVAKEKEIAMGQVQEQASLKDKPEQVKEKIVEGKLRSFFDENCLLNQKYVKDEKFTVEQFLAQKSKETGKTLAVTQFTLWTVGESA